MDTPDVAPELSAAARLATFIDRLRPSSAEDADAAAYNVQREIARLTERQHEAAALRADVLRLLSRPGQQAVYAESGVRSGFGFWLELKQRLGRRLLPPPQAEQGQGDLLRAVFRRPQDHRWVAAVDYRLLNPEARLKGRNPTAELLAQWCFEDLEAAGARPLRVKVREKANYWAACEAIEP